MATEIDPVCVVNDAIENGIGVGGIADQLVPFVDRDLAGDDRRSAAITFFEDFEEIMAGCGIERLKSPIIEDEKLHAAEGAQQAGVRAIAAREREVGEQLGNALVEDGSIVATGLVAESACEPTFADPGWPAQDQILMHIDPVTCGEFLE